MGYTGDGSLKNDDLIKRLGHEKEPTKDEIIERLKRDLNVQKKIVSHLRETRKEVYKTGEYQEKVITHGDTTTRNETRFEKNPMKLSLCWIGNIEIYCYPYSNFNKIYIRYGRKTQAINIYELPKLMLGYNRAKWFLTYGSDIAKRKMLSESDLAIEIQNAYNAGIEMELKEDSERDKKERIAMLKRVIQMKPEFREQFLEDDPILRRMHEEYLSIGGEE